ncbi:tripartite tricarboxylate transporter permease [Alkalihalobacillus oceani]|uniref:Tripartite tricarboxylate transporter permease n=1 Tax=Halalkalibacter oceani TaxID=1653776 RepID=A0A9X2DN20_9BACI|nr:tripartite tricarboxylate transporter permease [Halalkalibacter oceani]MCM3712965.1 tripartite tricarboxylate transporter permease [Halalkalibacter oceani]
MDILLQLFEVRHLLMLVLGLCLGIAVGALPGLTPTMGVALTIPFTFSLGATDGLILLGGIYCGSVFGGSIPAILFNVPGAPASVATTFDGYPMAQKGKARKALELATIASFAGGVIGMILLVFFAPVLTEFSLAFGPTESFWIALFGITVIAVISEGGAAKNMLGGCLGIVLSFVGISTVTGTARFTFGIDSFVGGFHVVAVLIGLFAIPQAFRMIEDLSEGNQKIKRHKQTTASSIRQSFGDVLKRPKAVTIGSGVGALIGMLPGAGGNVASVLAYNEVRRFSKQKNAFGNGEKQGIIASESANNAMVGGSLIPLLTLGIPGSPTAAIFLGGLLIHGIWPGRNLFVEHADVAYTFIYSMILAQFFLLVLGLLLVTHIARLTSIPTYYLAPAILSLSIIGAFTTQNSLFDVYTALILGLLMFVLQKFQFSPAPIALGFILGKIAEEGLLQGIQIGTAQGSPWLYFFSGTWNLLLCSFILITVGIAVYRGLKNRANQQPTLEGKRAPDYWAVSGWFIAGALVIVCLVLLNSMPFELRIFPQLTFSAMLGFLLYKAVQAVKRPKERVSFTFDYSIVMCLVLVATLSFLTNLLGFYSQTFLLMLLVPIFVHLQKWRKLRPLHILFVSCLFTMALYAVFTLLLKVPVPIMPQL